MLAFEHDAICSCMYRCNHTLTGVSEFLWGLFSIIVAEGSVVIIIYMVEEHLHLRVHVVDQRK